MTWKLWLDDQINDPDCPDRHAPVGFVGISNSDYACYVVALHGLPEFMDLDHDLGEEDNAMRFLKAIANNFPNGPVPAYNVHSQNPVGKKNIESFLESWKKSLEV